MKTTQPEEESIFQVGDIVIASGHTTLITEKNILQCYNIGNRNWLEIRPEHTRIYKNWTKFAHRKAKR